MNASGVKRQKNLRNRLLASGIVAALVVGLLASYYWPSLNTPANPPPVTQTVSTCVKPQGSYLIIADIQGFNNSVSHLHASPNEPWPVIRVHKGDRVTILVCNLDDYSPHGFAIEHYFDSGVALMPHESFRFSFIADQAGSFTMYCNIFCPVHSYMQSGQLIVTD